MAKFLRSTTEVDAIQWFKNGDHPNDYTITHYGHENGELREFSPEERRAKGWEGDVVRYYREPDDPGDRVCGDCGLTMHHHGRIDHRGQSCVVCPGDWIVTEGSGIYSAYHQDAFARLFTLVTDPDALALGIPALDQFLNGGVRPGEVVALTAPTAQHKTQTLLTIAGTVAARLPASAMLLFGAGDDRAAALMSRFLRTGDPAALERIRLLPELHIAPTIGRVQAAVDELLSTGVTVPLLVLDTAQIHLHGPFASEHRRFYDELVVWAAERELRVVLTTTSVRQVSLTQVPQAAECTGAGGELLMRLGLACRAVVGQRVLTQGPEKFLLLRGLTRDGEVVPDAPVAVHRIDTTNGTLDLRG